MSKIKLTYENILALSLCGLLEIHVLDNFHIKFLSKYLNIFLKIKAIKFVIIFCPISIAYFLIREIYKDKKLENEFNKSKEYIWYGKYVNGVIHNIKNKLTPIYLLLEEIKDDKTIDKTIRKISEDQINNSDNIVTLLDKLLSVTKNQNDEIKKYVNVNKIVKSILEFFKINLSFKNNIKIELKEDKDLIIKTIPFELMQVLENIIKNSWDELKDKNGDKNIFIKINSKQKSISIRDNGSGISECFCCKKKRCFNKCKIFKIGKSKKQDGLGYGMIYVREYIIKNNFKGDIISNKNGTEIKIFF